MKEGGCGPDIWSLPDFLASLCSLRTEMERIDQEQSKVRQKSGQMGLRGGGGRVEKTLTSPSCSLCLSQTKRQEASRGSQQAQALQKASVRGQ